MERENHMNISSFIEYNRTLIDVDKHVLSACSHNTYLALINIRIYMEGGPVEFLHEAQELLDRTPHYRHEFLHQRISHKIVRQLLIGALWVEQHNDTMAIFHFMQARTLIERIAIWHNATQTPWELP